MKALMEYVPLIAFFIVYKTVDIYWAAGALVVGMLLMMGIQVAMKEAIKKSTIAMFIFALIMAVLTIVFRDEAFLKWKFTVIYGMFGAVLLTSRYVVGSNLIKKSMGGNFTLPDSIWDRVNLIWSVFFFCCAALNVYIFNHWSLDSWVNFKVFGVIGMTFVLIVATVFYIYPHLPEEDKQ